MPPACLAAPVLKPTSLRGTIQPATLRLCSGSLTRSLSPATRAPRNFPSLEHDHTTLSRWHANPGLVISFYNYPANEKSKRLWLKC